jgi:DNA-binding response OmpR family regulator
MYFFQLIFKIIGIKKVYIRDHGEKMNRKKFYSSILIVFFTQSSSKACEYIFLRFKLNFVDNISQNEGELELTSGQANFIIKENELWKDDKKIHLTQKEMAIFKYLFSHPNEIISREKIVEEVWGEGTSISNVVDVHIKNLRKKLEMKKKEPIIETVWGLGYRFVSS